MAVLHLLITILLFHDAASAAAIYRRAETPGLFVFGSSLVDNGNNNFLPNTTAKANYRPYGIDFPLGPSGRFSNGKNMIDAFGELLCLRKPIPPFLDPRTRGAAIIHGVNYASGGSGILDETGSVGGKVMSLKEQISNFEATTLPELKRVLGGSVDLSRYIFVVGTGGNDYLLNYFLNNKGESLESFTVNLISTLHNHLQRLEGLGARKFLVTSVQPIGCVPVVRANGNSSGCVEAVNGAAVMFNTRLRSLLESAGDSHFVYVNSFDLIRDLFNNPEKEGLREAKKGCCEVDVNGILCREGGRVCGDREGHVFFDGLHPTETVNLLLARRTYSKLKQLANI